MANSVAKTDLGPTMSVAIDQYFPERQRIINDDLAYKIMPAGMRAFVRLFKIGPMRSWMIRVTERDFPGIWGCMLCRKRYIDEKITDSAGSISAIVNLGAGLDTRAFRLPSMSGIKVWETDQPENISYKKVRLQKLLGEIPPEIKLVSIDFDCEKIGTVLESHGYSLGYKTFFIMEGVTQYISETGIRSAFDFLARTVPGSLLVFTYIRKDFIEGRQLYGSEKLFDRYANKDRIWIFGMNPEEWPDFLNRFGWKIIEDADYSELNEKYIKPSGRILLSTQIERIIFAEKM